MARWDRRVANMGVTEVEAEESGSTRELIFALKADAKKIRDVLSREGISIREISRPRVASGVLYVATAWFALGIFCFLWLSGYWFLQIVAFIGFGFVGHAFLLIMHEASHHSLFPDRRLNDLIADYFIAIPAGHTVESYRATHFLHHKYVNLDEDPTGFISNRKLGRRQTWINLLLLLCGRPVLDLIARTIKGQRAGGVLSNNHERQQKIAYIERLRLCKVAIYHIIALAGAVWLGVASLWVAWFISLITITTFLDGVRVVIEHRAFDDDKLGFHTRSHHVSNMLSAIIAPVFQYHWEHHAMPFIPHCRLGRLHDLLIRHGVAEAHNHGGPAKIFQKAMIS